MTFIARDYQTEAVDTLYDYFRTHKEGNPVIAMPTGTGKSGVIGMFLMSIFCNGNPAWLSQKVLILTHVQELIEQNYEELIGMWPTAPAGIYSAGLDKRDTVNPIIFAGIASVAKKAKDFGRVNLVIIDEAHLVSPTDATMYRRFIAELLKVNPFLRVIGLTATPWRLGQGKITDPVKDAKGADVPSLFTHICFDITGIAAFNRLIAEGYLAPLVTKRTQTVLDVDGVHMRGGEFIASELQHAVDRDEITEAALREAVELGHNRVSWLIFCAGVEHAQNTGRILRDIFGIPCVVVHGDMGKAERKNAFELFTSGKVRALIGNNIATTGFNHKPVDMIICLRPTASTPLWVQMLGRGTRPYDPANPGRVDPVAFPYLKRDCLVLDFAGNTKRLGPINDPVIPRKKGQKGGTAPVRLCEKCECYVHASLVRCNTVLEDGTLCDNEFPRETKIGVVASDGDVIKGDLPVVEVMKVDHITYSVHNKLGGSTASVKVSYYCGLRKFDDYVCIGHGDSYAGRKARRWWRERSSTPEPESPQELIDRHGEVMVPTHIRVWLNKKYPEILAYCYDGSCFGTQVPGSTDAPSAEAVTLARPHMPQPPAQGETDYDSFDDDIPF